MRETSSQLTCATLIPVDMLAAPASLELCKAVKTRPRSFVKVTRTSGLEGEMCMRSEVSIQYTYAVALLNRPLASHGHQSDFILWIRVDLGIEEDIDCIGLRFPPRRGIVSIAHPLRVVQAA